MRFDATAAADADARGDEDMIADAAVVPDMRVAPDDAVVADCGEGLRFALSDEAILAMALSHRIAPRADIGDHS